MRGRAGTIGFTVLAVIVMVSVPTIATARFDDPEATIAALQTEVAVLQTQVAALSTPTSAATSQPTTNTQSTLVGDAENLLPVGGEGIVSVVAAGPSVRGALPIAVRNNTGQDVLLNSVIAIGRDASGTLIVTSSSSMLAPYRLPAGQVAVGDVYFGPDDIPTDLTFEFEAQLDSPDNQFLNRQDLVISEVTQSDTEIVGIAVNPTNEKLSGPFSVVGICVDASGAIRGYYAAYAVKMELAPGESTPFSATHYGGGPCDSFALGVTGYKGF